MAKDYFQFRWGIKAWDVGSTIIPNPVLEHYSQVPWTDKSGKSGCGISNQEMMCIIHIASFRYESERGQARPAIGTIRERMGYKKDDSISRMIAALEHKNLLTVDRIPGLCNIYDVKKFSEAILLLDENPPTGMGDPTGMGEESPIGVGEESPTGMGTKNKREEEKIRKEDSNSNLPSLDSSVSGEIVWEEPEGSELVEITIEKLSRTFGDLKHLKSNITRAYNLWNETSLGEHEFVARLEEAAARTKEAISKSMVKDRAKRMAYFFSVLEGLLT